MTFGQGKYAHLDKKPGFNNRSEWGYTRHSGRKLFIDSRGFMRRINGFSD